MAKQRNRPAIKAEMKAHGNEDEALQDEPLGFVEEEDVNLEDYFDLEDLDRLNAGTAAVLDEFYGCLIYHEVVEELGFNPLAAMA